MKKMILAVSLLSVLAQARALDTIDKARRVQNIIQESILGIPGVNGIGISGCNPQTGVQDVENDFVHCVSISTETLAAYKSVLRTYPQGVKFRGVFVVVKRIGKIVPQPRMSGGQ